MNKMNDPIENAISAFRAGCKGVRAQWDKDGRESSGSKLWSITLFIVFAAVGGAILCSK